MEKTISRNDPNYRAIMDRHYVSLDKPENKNPSREKNLLKNFEFPRFSGFKF